MHLRGNNKAVWRQDVLNVFDELDMPDNRLTQERSERVLQGAKLGKAAVEVFDGYSDVGVLYGAVRKLAVLNLKPDVWVGMCAGVRAARFGEPADWMCSEGESFRITNPTEVEQIQSAKIAGMHVAELNEDKDFLSILTDTLSVANSGASTFQQASDFLGITLGMQEVQLQGVRL